MANVYLNTDNLELYKSTNGINWIMISGSSPYTLAVNTYYKLTAAVAAPDSGQIFTGWTLINNVDDIIQLSNQANNEVTFNTLNQTWKYPGDITIHIKANYEDEDNFLLNKRGLKDVVNRLTKVQKITDFPTVENAKENTLYIKCKESDIEKLNEDIGGFNNLSDLANIFSAPSAAQADNIRTIEELVLFLQDLARRYTNEDNEIAMALANKYQAYISEWYSWEHE